MTRYQNLWCSLDAEYKGNWANCSKEMIYNYKTIIYNIIPLRCCYKIAEIVSGTLSEYKNRYDVMDSSSCQTVFKEYLSCS